MLVAVSGGPDSVALLRGLAALVPQASDRTRLEVAHFNHHWRPGDADQDEQFVRDLARGLQLEFHVGHGSAPASGQGEGWEALARRERYEFLAALARTRHARYVAVGHTRDDQMETVLSRIVRGTGLDGLTGIPRVRSLTEDVVIVRPLLTISRPTIREYLTELGQSARCDATNRDPRFLRGRIRTELWPLLATQFNPHLGEALLRLSESAAETQELVHELVESYHAACYAGELPGGCELHRAALQRLPLSGGRALLRRVWRDHAWPEREMSRQRWLELWDVVSGPTGGKATFPGGISVEVRTDTVALQAGQV